MVGPIAKKGVEQVAVGAVQLHAVESGLDGAARGKAEVLDNARELVQFERARRRVDEAFVRDEGLGSCPDCRRTPGARPSFWKLV